MWLMRSTPIVCHSLRKSIQLFLAMQFLPRLPPNLFCLVIRQTSSWNHKFNWEYAFKWLSQASSGLYSYPNQPLLAWLLPTFAPFFRLSMKFLISLPRSLILGILTFRALLLAILESCYSLGQLASFLACRIAAFISFCFRHVLKFVILFLPC